MDSTNGEAFSFYGLSLVILLSALMVVSLRNIVHCALFLVLAFIGVAGIFFLLDAEFIAAVQILIYVGAITVLLLFAIMLTQKATGASLAQTNKLSPLAVLSGTVFSGMVAIISATTSFPAAPGKVGDSTRSIAQAILGNGPFVVPFEVASILLLAAMVGAIVIARERDK